MPRWSRAALFWDLVLGVLGTAAFLLDLGADLWAAGQYLRSGRYLWAALVLALLLLASVALQLFSWIWLRADPTGLHGSQPSSRCLELLHLLQLGYLYRGWPDLKWTRTDCVSERMRPKRTISIPGLDEKERKETERRIKKKQFKRQHSLEVGLG